MRRWALAALLLLWPTSASAQYTPGLILAQTPNTVCLDHTNKDTCIVRGTAGQAVVASAASGGTNYLAFGSGGVTLQAGGKDCWSSTTDATAAGDTGLARVSAGLIKATDCSTTNYATLGNGGLNLQAAGTFGFAPSTDATAACDVCFIRDATDIAAMKRGANRQMLRLYGDDGASFLSLTHAASNAAVKTTQGSLFVDAAVGSSFGVRVNGVDQYYLNVTAFTPAASDNGQDEGSSGSRFRKNYVGTQVIIGSAPAVALTGSEFISGVAFASLATPDNGTLIFCTDCDPPTLVDSTCASVGTKTGSLAFRVNGAWKCIS